MIHVERLTKRYGERVLFEDVSWHVRKQDRIRLQCFRVDNSDAELTFCESRPVRVV